MLIFTLMFFGLSFSANAQFLKNLKKQVVEKTQNAIIDKTANKVAESVSDKISDQISGAVDNALGADWGEMMGSMGKVKDIETLPASYSFDYIYSMKMITDDGEFPMDYYLSKSGSYMGAKFSNASDITMVFDDQNKALIAIVGDNVIATEMDIDSDLDSIDSISQQNVKITDLPNKTFLGYDCVGKHIESEEYNMTIYVTKDTSVSFANMFNNKYSKMPKQMNFTSNNEGMVMHAEIIDKSKADYKVNIECTAFDKTEFIIKTR